MAMGMQSLDEAIAGREPKGGWDWYTWSIAHWGTKWDVEEILAEDEDTDYIGISFETAWSPPIEWVIAVSKKFPSLYFVLTYSEPGMGFAGEYRACKKDGIYEDINFPEGSEEYNELVGGSGEDFCE